MSNLALTTSSGRLEIPGHKLLIWVILLSSSNTWILATMGSLALPLCCSWAQTGAGVFHAGNFNSSVGCFLLKIHPCLNNHGEILGRVGADVPPHPCDLGIHGAGNWPLFPCPCGCCWPGQPALLPAAPGHRGLGPAAPAWGAQCLLLPCPVAQRGQSCLVHVCLGMLRVVFFRLWCFSALQGAETSWFWGGWPKQVLPSALSGNLPALCHPCRECWGGSACRCHLLSSIPGLPHTTHLAGGSRTPWVSPPVTCVSVVQHFPLGTLSQE